MLETELFQKTFSKLRASPDTGKELDFMTNTKRQPKKFILRKLVIAAAVSVLAAATALGANAATGGELFGTVVTYLRSWTENGATVDLYETEIDGEKVYVAVDSGAEVEANESGVTVYMKDEDGAAAYLKGEAEVTTYITDEGGAHEASSQPE